MSETLPAALHMVSDGPLRLQRSLQRSARRLRSGAVTSVAAVRSPLPPLLLDGGLGPLFSDRLRALLTTAAAPPAVAESGPTPRAWELPPGAPVSTASALLAGDAGVAPHFAPLRSGQSQQAHLAGTPDFAETRNGAAPAVAASATIAGPLSGAALLRDRINRALAAPSAVPRAPSSRPSPRPALHTGADGVAPTAAQHAAGAPASQGAVPHQAMTPAAAEAALRAFAEGKSIAGHTSTPELLQTSDTIDREATWAANGAPLAPGAGSRSTLAPSAHFSPQGFVFANSEGAAPPAPEALAESLATILRTQARAHGIELP